jgi:hypothetical protein
MIKFPILAFTALAAALALTGCRIHHSENGDKENVAISTPFGSVNVKTNGDGAALTGLTVYPGATPLKDDDHDSDSADVNLSFGDFHLGVKAASYSTPDAPAKVIAFYKNDMTHFGDVIECQNDKPIGTPVRTSQGLTCEEKSHNTTHSSDHDEIELRTGSPSAQHIVGVEPKGSGTKIGLVMLNLPKGMNSHDSRDPD